MPGETAAARRYARAVFELASERGDTGRWQQDLDAIASLMGNADAATLFASGKMPQSAKDSLVVRALGSIVPMALNFAKLLVRKQRTALAPDIARIFREMADEAQGISHATV